MPFRLSYLVPRMAAFRQRDLFAWSLLAAVILLALLATHFFAVGLYTAGVLDKIHLPAKTFPVEQPVHDESFDWTPDVYSDFCLTGEGQVGTYHPLHYVLYRYLPLRTALVWEYLCSYPLMLAGMYFLLRRRLRRQDAAMLGSLAFTLSSFNLLNFVHPNAVAAVAHIPWLLALIDIIMVDARRWKVATAQALLALLTGSQILLGCPQYVWFSLVAEASFTLFLVMTRRYLPRDGCETLPTCCVCVGCWRNSSLRVVISKGIGLLVGAVQLLPALEAFSQGTRGGGASAASATLHPINLIQLVAPYLPVNRVFGGYTHELSLYVGAVPLMLALSVFVRRCDLGPMKRLAQGAAALAVAALLLALGSHCRFIAWPNSIPWLGWLQFSCRYMILFQFAVAVLAAIGFMVVTREARQQQKIRRCLPILGRRLRAAALWRQFEILGATVLVSLAVAVAGLILRSNHQVAPVSYVLAGPLLMAAAAALVIAAAQGSRGAMVGLILFMAADLGYYGLTWMQVPDPLPLVRLIPHVAPKSHTVEDLAKLDIRSDAPGESGAALPPGKTETAVLTEFRSGQMAVRVGCRSPQVLVIAECYHPAWQCTIDGHSKRVYRVDDDFLGCIVEPGDSEVRLEFHADSLFRGRFLTFAGLGLIGLCLVSGTARWELPLAEKIGWKRSRR